MRTLTDKQKRVADKFLAIGSDPSARLTAIESIYNTKNRRSALSIHGQLKKNPVFMQYLTDREKIFGEVSAVCAPTLAQLVEQKIPRETRIEKLKKIIQSGGNREAIEAIKEIHALIGEYAPSRSLNVNYEMADERKQIIEPD